MVSVLIMGERERAKITAAIERARRHPEPLDQVRARAAPLHGDVLMLADRALDWRRPSHVEEVLIPADYRLALSFEEQAAGVCIHISISLLRRAKEALPHPEAVAWIAEACGICLSAGVQSVWVEEFLDGDVFGGRAVNIVYLVAPRAEGHA